MLQSMEATVIDARHLQLNQPILILAGSTVLITVTSPEESERQAWLSLAEQSLAAAYSVDEPDYPAKLVKEPNPDYQA